MSKYTIELRHLCDYYTRDTVESWFKDYHLTDYLTQEEINIINNRGTWSKEKLARKIVDYYFMREIGFETPELFRIKAKSTMDMIMESKLPLIYSSSIKYDPLVNVDYTETYTREIDGSGNTTGTSQTNATGLTINSDTPQGQINKTDILSGNYATNTQGGESQNNVSDRTDSQTQTLETSSKNIKGNSGVSASAQKMIEQYRDNIRSIDYDIIKELNILFMGLF